MSDKKLLKHSHYKHVTGTEERVVLTALPDQMRLAAEFQIMDAGWSVKLQRFRSAARLTVTCFAILRVRRFKRDARV